ncbi:hypothetical protein [Georgenia faecalis]|uniref:Glycosyl-4,4'-diaponeurosporenoate acyltransferase n=1 Tax=Georgenia faecalis TaxID=2483799 RepID=A0ABV9D819_9MICO|nr:hypothetical protein [Georgenia faecalis]
MRERPEHPIAAAVIGVALATTLAVAGWSFIGPDHLVYALTVQGGFTFLGLLAGPLLVDTLHRRYTVASAEPRIYALVGAQALRRLLGRVGWNRAIASMREQGPGSTRLERLARGTQLSETGHAIGGAATLVLAATAILAQQFVGAAQIVMVGLVFHGYPMMIQRIVRYRIVQRIHR